MNGRKRRGSEPGNRGGRRRADRSEAGALKAVRTGVGAALQTDHSDVLREPLSEEMVELLTQLRQSPED